MSKKKRFLVLFVLLAFFGIYLTISVRADCSCNPECSQGQTENGGNCADCGSTMRRDCQSDCTWGGWYCQNNVPGNYGQSCNCGACGCGGTIQCSGTCSGGNSAPPNYGQSCGNCGTINCAGSCINQGSCSPGQTQCLNDRYQTCSSGCQWQNSGTNADNDAKDLQCGDSLCDNSPNVYDSTKTPTENACTDGLDNDCDQKTDCNDSDCDGSITGAIKTSDNQPIVSADVSAKKDLTTVKSTTTNQQGSYTISPINCGTYNLVASHPDYAPQTKNNVNVAPQQQTTSNFEGGSSLVLGTSCEQDCTFAADNIIHASCDGKNGCSFYDSTAKAACDNAQPGWFRDYDGTHYITCASGMPQPKIEIQASVSCASGTLVKVTKIVIYNGKPVKLVVATCG